MRSSTKSWQKSNKTDISFHDIISVPIIQQQTASKQIRKLDFENLNKVLKQTEEYRRKLAYNISFI